MNILQPSFLFLFIVGRGCCISFFHVKVIVKVKKAASSAYARIVLYILLHAFVVVKGLLFYNGM